MASPLEGVQYGTIFPMDSPQPFALSPLILRNPGTTGFEFAVSPSIRTGPFVLQEILQSFCLGIQHVETSFRLFQMGTPCDAAAPSSLQVIFLDRLRRKVLRKVPKTEAVRQHSSESFLSRLTQLVYLSTIFYCFIRSHIYGYSILVFIIGTPFTMTAFIPGNNDYLPINDGDRPEDILHLVVQ
jgi:hypothetical protein